MTKRDEKEWKEYDLTWFSTYDAPILSTPAVVKQCARSRLWNNAFSTRKIAFQSLLANGFLPTTHYEDDLQWVVKSKAVRVTGQMFPDPRSTFDWSFVPIYNRISVDPYGDWAIIEMVNSIKARLAQKVSGHNVSVPMTLKDLPQTISMIANAATKLRTAYVAVKHGKFRAAARTLGINTPKGVSLSKSFSQNWLEYRYGWRLTCYDIQGYLMLIHDMMNRPQLHRQTAMEERCGIWDRTSVENYYLPNGLHALSVDVRRITTWTSVVRGGYIYEIVNEAWNQGQGFGLLNPLEFAWDIIPFSFVLDWFTNIGDVLQGLTAFVGKTCRDGWICREIQSDTSTVWSNIQKGDGIFQLNPGTTLTIDGQIERRFRRDLSPFDPADFQLSFGMNLSRLTDAFSLVRQLRG